MKIARFAAVVLLAGMWVGVAGPAVAQDGAPQPWLHVEITADGNESENVAVNVPLSAAEAMLALAPEGLITDGQLSLEHHDVPVSVEAMRGVWQSLMAAGDTEFVTVEQGDQTVRVARVGQYIEVRVNDREDDGGESVDVQLPITVVDALLSGDSDTLNVRAAINRLGDLRGDIVRVSESDRRIRVWIDERSTQ